MVAVLRDGETIHQSGWNYKEL